MKTRSNFPSALIDFLVVPGAGHGVAGSPYGKRRMQDFFVRHLLGKEPRWQN